MLAENIEFIDATNGTRDLGGYERHLGDRPWHAQRTDADGTRWNFTWQGHPYAYVYSPDLGKPLPDNEYLWVLRPQEQAGDQDVIEWLDGSTSGSRTRGSPSESGSNG